MLGEVTDMRSVKMVNRKRRGKKPGTKWSRKMGRAGMLMVERDYAPVAADDRWGERNRAAQAEREARVRAERERAERAKAERAKAERERAERERAEREQAEREQFMAQLRELEEQVRDVDFERPLPRREKSILTRENLRIADELAGVGKPLAGCSALLLVVLVVAVVCGVVSFFV